MSTPALDSEDVAFAAIWEECAPFTMTSWERGLALFRAIRYLGQNFMAGDIVECGVWRGGSSMIAMRTLQHFGMDDRRVWLFDTFAGMTEAGSHDFDCHGQSAEVLMAQSADRRESELVWAFCGIDEVRCNVARTGYRDELIKFVPGDVRHTLPTIDTGPIALLRLDTDFYDSTLAELDILYPRLIENGVLIVDDFGHWQGARRACDEYFDNEVRNGRVRPLFQTIDYTGRLVIKPRTALAANPVSRHDYHPPGLLRPELLGRFPEAIVRDPEPIGWPYLRREVPHVWRTDSRAEALVDTGILSVEEATLLFNNALRFAGGRGLEIGCHYGWSTAHLAAAGLNLDVVDPALADDRQHDAVRESVNRAQGLGRCNLWAGYSPNVLQAVHGHGDADYDFVFIDGNHDGEHPGRDARAVTDLCCPTACVMLHDLNSPYVAAALEVFAEHGWQVGIYNTMQIMGVAWRGDITPARHVADPAIPRQLPTFLSQYRLISE